MIDIHSVVTIASGVLLAFYVRFLINLGISRFYWNDKSQRGSSGASAPGRPKPISNSQR